MSYPGIKSKSFHGLNKGQQGVLCKGCKQDKDNWYSIGLCDKWEYKGNVGIPGPINICVQCTELYIFDINSMLKEFIQKLMINNDWI